MMTVVFCVCRYEKTPHQTYVVAVFDTEKKALEKLAESPDYHIETHSVE